MTLFLDDGDFQLHQGDVRETLAGLDSESVNCVVTSPPYWGLRDYGTGDQSLGLEATPELFVENMVQVFREVRRVLRADGTCWVNLGDSYATVTGEGGFFKNGRTDGRPASSAVSPRGRLERKSTMGAGLKPKDLCGIPWRVAFALQQDGWWLRSDIVWSKPNPMPESVTDRPTKAHEYVFLFTKSARYWFDQEAVREAYQPSSIERKRYTTNDMRSGHVEHNGRVKAPTGSDYVYRENPPANASGRNVRSVWEIATQPYPEAHFATYPEELVRRCVLAGCPEWVCGTCGKPRERIVETSNPYAGVYSTAKTLGWSDCGHDNYRPGIVLDPFLGSGTTALVARKHGRHTIGIELSPAYCALAARRLQQLSLLTS